MPIQKFPPRVLKYLFPKSTSLGVSQHHVKNPLIWGHGGGGGREQREKQEVPWEAGVRPWRGGSRKTRRGRPRRGAGRHTRGCGRQRRSQQKNDSSLGPSEFWSLLFKKRQVRGRITTSRFPTLFRVIPKCTKVVKPPPHRTSLSKESGVARLRIAKAESQSYQKTWSGAQSDPSGTRKAWHSISTNTLYGDTATSLVKTQHGHCSTMCSN